MSTVDPISYTLIADDGLSSLASTQELRQALEKGSDDVKLETLRKIIVSTINGVPHPNLLMPIIQYVLPNRNKQIKKMLAFYWEVCPKLDDNGKLKQEMILVCNAIRNDLQHPNEYIRGTTLRAVQKIHEAELLEPLVPTVRSCMEHRHPYVRKNAVFTVFSIYKQHEILIPDAPELLLTFLAAESDATCKRNAFVSLCSIAPQRAIEYLLSIYDSIPALDELFQLAVIDLVRKEARSGVEGPHKAKWIRTIFELLNASSHTVKYEAATSLTTLTQNPAAVKASASAFIELCVKEADNNVKLIVLERINQLRARHEHVLDPLVMDLLRVLASNDMEVRRKALSVALEMVTGRNVEEVVGSLKKQLANTMEESSYERNLEYRQLLIQSIHSCAIKFSEVAASVVHVLMEFIGDAGNSSAVDVIAFVREVVEKFPKLRHTITERLLQTIGDVKSGKVFRGALWIVGEYCSEVEDIQAAFAAIRKIIGEVPILASEQRLLEELEGPSTEDPSKPVEHKPSTTTRVLADGTYATETVYSSTVQEKEKIAKIRAASKAPLRALLLAGDFYTGSVLASSITKLVLRLHQISSEASLVNGLRAEAMLIMASVVRVGQSRFVAVPIDEDSQERILNCVQTLAQLEQSKPAQEIFLEDTKAAYAKMVSTAERKVAEKKAKESKSSQVQADDQIVFRQFSKKPAGGDVDELDTDLTRATGSADLKDDFISKLSRVVQLTGFSDPVYAEAVVNVHQFDILLDVLIVNQTQDTLQNLTIDFATLGDLKLVERPVAHTLAPHGFHSIKATIKVSSTETGVIFGNIVYDGQGASDLSSTVVLNDIHVDIMDYIKPSYCNEAQFRSMWTEFEWENKVNVNTNITDLRQYLQHLMKSTNMACLTADAALSGDCDFLSANCYARSLFGEDALANLSIERAEDGTISGHIRIRSKTQGIALSLGDRCTTTQKLASNVA